MSVASRRRKWNFSSSGRSISSSETAVSLLISKRVEVALVMAGRQGIEVDYCPQCRGVWLDDGELDKIIEHAALASGGGIRKTS